MPGMLDRLQIDRILGYFAAGQTKRTSAIIDMAGFDGVIFVADLSTLLETGTLDVFVEQNVVNSGTGMARLATTTAYTVTAADALKTQSCILVEVYRPLERYLQANITPATANAVITGITSIRYHGVKSPPTRPANVLKSTRLVSPAEA